MRDAQGMPPRPVRTVLGDRTYRAPTDLLLPIELPTHPPETVRNRQRRYRWPATRQAPVSPNKIPKKWKMRTHQQRIVQSIYAAAAEPSSWLANDYARWMDDLRLRRGELDRKKKIRPEWLADALGIEAVPVDLYRFIYATERYVATRALRTIEICLEQPLDEFPVVPAAVKASLSFSAEIASLLQRCCPEEYDLDTWDLRQLALRTFETGLKDEFQAEFMGLIPRQVRHAIGSFYTPQWLARHMLRSLGYCYEEPSSITKSVCDPSCGSGVFLIAAAEEIRQAAASGKIDPQTAVDLVLNSLHGIDVELVPCLLATASLTLAAKVIARNADLQLTSLPSSIQHADTLDAREGGLRYDYLVGNPPWVNWEYMPGEYRAKHAQLWIDLDIFDKQATTMSFSKEDISALFVAHAIHYRLKNDGLFAFVLPESLFKSTLNHRGFRTFRLGKSQTPYRVGRLEDFVEVKPFEGVANRTVAVFGANGLPTEYPLPVIKWTGFGRQVQPVSGDANLNGQRTESLAQLAEANVLESSWSTGTTAAFEAHRKLDGANFYRARTGLFSGGANAVYHLRPLEAPMPGTLRVENVVERAKRLVPRTEAELEDLFIHPFLRGRDVRQWGSTVELAVLLPHTSVTKMAPVSEEVLKELAPATLRYLSNFREILDERRGFSTWEKQYRDIGFYACQRVGEYTFADWKVVWRYISPRFTSAVVGPVSFAGMKQKAVIPNEKLMLIACATQEEAFFLGGVLAGSVVVEHVHSRMVSTQISPSIVSGIAIPRFDPDDLRHMEIAELCRDGHAARRQQDADLGRIVRRLDVQVAALWGVSQADAANARTRNPF